MNKIWTTLLLCSALHTIAPAQKSQAIGLAVGFTGVGLSYQSWDGDRGFQCAGFPGLSSGKTSKNDLVQGGCRFMHTLGLRSQNLTMERLYWYTGLGGLYRNDEYTSEGGLDSYYSLDRLITLGATLGLGHDQEFGPLRWSIGTGLIVAGLVHQDQGSARTFTQSYGLLFMPSFETALHFAWGEPYPESKGQLSTTDWQHTKSLGMGVFWGSGFGLEYTQWAQSWGLRANLLPIHTLNVVHGNMYHNLSLGASILKHLGGDSAVTQDWFGPVRRHVYASVGSQISLEKESTLLQLDRAGVAASIGIEWSRPSSNFGIEFGVQASDFYKYMSQKDNYTVNNSRAWSTLMFGGHYTFPLKLGVR